jgi:polysaccharide biosynthesis/export protein
MTYNKSQPTAYHILKNVFAAVAAALFFSSLLSSCTITKQPQYFYTLNKDTTITGFVPGNFESKIKKGDQLAISVSSLSRIEDELFNKIDAGSAASTAGATISGYTVLQDGTVLLHRLGNVVAEGLTRKEFAQKVQKDLLAYMKEPIVNVSYLNHKITVLGEVRSPGIINLPQEQITVLDALVLSGDVNFNANRTNIMIIRDNGNEKKIKHINLEDHSIFTSPFYYLQPEDIVMVTPDNGKYLKEEKRKKIQTTLSLAASGISLLIIILGQVIK